MASEDNESTAWTMSKRIHVRTESSRNVLAPSPPRKKMAQAVVFHSPDREDLKAALKSGGTANLNIKKGRSPMLISFSQINGVYTSIRKTE
jgi:hypothetical protein